MGFAFGQSNIRKGMQSMELSCLVLLVATKPNRGLFQLVASPLFPVNMKWRKVFMKKICLYDEEIRSCELKSVIETQINMNIDILQDKIR